MKKIYGLLLLLFAHSLLYAQVKLRFIVKEQTLMQHDSIFIAGTFNNWDSGGNKTYMLQPHGKDRHAVVVDVKPGAIRYKYTRGNWLTVEKNNFGAEMEDRHANITKDTVINDSIASWRDEVLIELIQRLQRASTDTDRINLMASIAAGYAFVPEDYNADSALFYAQKALQLHGQIMASDEYKLSVQSGVYQLANLQEILATLLHALGNYQKSLEMRFENVKLAEKENDKLLMVLALRNVTNDYSAMKDYGNMLKYGKLADSFLIAINRHDNDAAFEKWQVTAIISASYYQLSRYDSALHYAEKMKTLKFRGDPRGYNAYRSKLMGDIYTAKNENSTAYSYYQSALSNSVVIRSSTLTGEALSGLAKVFQAQGRIDSALWYARAAISEFQSNRLNIKTWGENADSYIADISPLMAALYKANNQPDSAYKYLQLSVTLKDSLFNTNKIRQFQTSSFNESARRQQLEQQSREAKQQYETKIKMIALVTGLLAFLIIAFVLYRNNLQKQKANTTLQQQKLQIETTLAELKTTQSQLIQSEKMASLGELTAGIAHEIQNPLNFVNNFSEVNKELLAEMTGEIEKGNYAEVKLIAKDITENEEKINHHGKRADAIVKGMLQHSRSSSATKEPTDINKLADEYLRLAYHGLRAKDKTFNATLKTDFDETMGLINIVPQDIGRVILNLITNAFYATNDKKKLNIANYEPTLSIATRSISSPFPKESGQVGGRWAEIRVSDNGGGVSSSIVDKIFQPFFTTKPTGQGTGLGLSLSYDIVKAHGGELKVESKETEGTTFSIQLPING